MINKETIISAYDEKLTLVQWLKLVNKALDEAVLTNVEIAQRGNATFVFVFTFEDGTQVESNEIIVNQGESINGASIRNGHLYLTLTNGDELDAGNVKPVSSFSINASQHLIVNYADGTSQDLGAIFSGNVNIDGTLTTTGKISAPIVDGEQVTGNEIVEKMSGYSFSKSSDTNYYELIYASVTKTGNKATFVVFGRFIGGQTIPANSGLGNFIIPSAIGQKLYPNLVGSTSGVLDIKEVTAFLSINNTYNRAFNCYVAKNSNTNLQIAQYGASGLALEQGQTAIFRYEVTFLLNDSLAGN